MAHQVGSQCFIIGEERRQLHAGGHARRAREGGDVDQQGWRFGIGIGQGIGQYQPAFGIGVADLDRQALAAGEDIGGTIGGAGHRIFHRRNQQPQAQIQFGAHHHAGHRQRHGRAAHVFFHGRHAAGGLEVIAAGVETDAFAHQGDFGAAAPDQFDQARCSRRAMAHRMNQRIIFFQRRAGDDAEFGAMAFGQCGGGGGQFLRPHVIGGRVDQVAGEKDAPGDAADFFAIHPGWQHQFWRPFVTVLCSG